MSKKKIRRPEKRVPPGAQRGFAFAAEPSPPPRPPAGNRGAPVFKKGRRHELFVGDVKLDDYLEQVGLGWVARMTRLLDEVDVSAMEARYDGTGRHPYHPRMLVCLVLYGVIEGKWSLRDLERLAARDVGAWWICGGLRPDHSTIGRFLTLHDETLTDEFFLSLTKTLVAKLRLGPGEAVIDGTVIEAVSSHVKALRHEALQKALADAKGVAGSSPEQAEAQAKVTQLEHAAEVLAERDAQRAAKGRSGKNNQPSGTAVVPHEPEAVVQTQKNKTVRPSYKPTIMTHIESGLIVGQAVNPSSETASLPTVMAQHGEVFGAAPACTMVDAAYFSAFALTFFLDRNLDVLCPSGRAFNAKSIRRQPRTTKRLLKSEFTYDADQDAYRCPANRLLVPEHSSTNKNGKYRRYRSLDCEGCALRERCTSSSRRTVMRYDADDVKDAQLEVMKHPAAQARFRRRSIGERPFSGLKGGQRLSRFHRRGLKGARLELALHAAAWNIRAGMAAPCLLFVALWIREAVPGAPWRQAGVFVVVAHRSTLNE
jgi:transposase